MHKFLIAKKFIRKKADFFCARPLADAPLFIIAWIMNEYAFVHHFDLKLLSDDAKNLDVILEGSTTPKSPRPTSGKTPLAYLQL